MASKKHPPLEMPPVSKHLWRTPGWMPVQQYREYQKKRVETARAERNEASCTSPKQSSAQSAGHPRSHGISALIAFRSWLAIR